MKKIILTVLSITFLSGCSFLKEHVYVNNTENVALQISKASDPVAPELNDIYWVVLNQNRIAESCALQEDVVYFALTPEEFKNLSDNILELKLYISNLKDRIKYYEDSIEKQKTLIEGSDGKEQPLQDTGTK